MNLIILTAQDCIGPEHYRLADHRAEHIRAILKLAVGDSLEVGLLNGPVGRGRIVALASDEIEIETSDWQEPEKPTPEIVLVCALPRPQTFKKILFTSAMMGVKSLHLIRANRVEKSYFQSPMVESDQQLPYLLEGLAQGKNSRLPEVIVHDRFRRFFEDSLDGLDGGPDGGALRLVGDSERNEYLDAVVVSTPDRVTLAIGPEGGWVPFELELMQSLGFHPVTLGRWILRVEHAVTAALAQLELILGRRS